MGGFKKIYILSMHSTHFIYSYMASVNGHGEMYLRKTYDTVLTVNAYLFELKQTQFFYDY